MGIRSDVGVAVKTNLVPLVNDLPIVRASSKRALFHKEGTLYVFEDVKWYAYTYEEIKALYEVLRGHEEDYLIVEACHEFPNSGADSGRWDDNPWDLCRSLSVTLNY